MESSGQDYQRADEDCQIDEDFVVPSDVPNKCWKADFTFDGKKYVLNNHQSALLNEYIEITYSASGIILNGEVCHSKKGVETCKDMDYSYDWQDPSWSISYTFKVIKPFLKSKITDYAYGNYAQNISVEYSVGNYLAKIDGGAVVRIKSVLFSPEKEQRDEKFVINKGINYFSTKTNSDILGDNELRIKPYALVYNKIDNSYSPVRIYDNEMSATARTLPNIAYKNLGNNETIQETQVKFKMPIILIISIIIIISGVIYIVTQKK